MIFAGDTSFWLTFAQQTLDGLTFGALVALIALGYTMVYGIVELINFAHGDLFMLGAFLCLTILAMSGLGGLGFETTMKDPSLVTVILLLGACLIAAMVFCAALNYTVDWVVYKPLRNAPKLAPLVSAIGVSFVFMNVGLFWGGAQDVDFPKLIEDKNLLPDSAGIRFTSNDLMVFLVTIPLMIGLTLFVKYASLGKAMRATAQNPTAAKLMGINTDRVIGITFAIGGALAGASSLVYALKVNTISYQMGFQNGLYAFTAAVLGGIGRIPGAVLGGLVIGLVRTYGSAYVGEAWIGALIFGILILILIFRPTGLLGSATREKV
jgi:branched-chain amino acid transport system permease protein